MGLANLRWRAIIVAAIAAEIALLPLTLGLGWLGYALGWEDLPVSVAFSLLMVLALFPAGYWAARKSGSNPLLTGAAVGVLAALIFLPVLMMGLAGGIIEEVINEMLKVTGGTFGGWWASRSYSAVQPPSIE